MTQAAVVGNQQNENPGAQVEEIPPVGPAGHERVQNNDGNNVVDVGEPEIVNITDQNRYLIRDSLGGMIVLPNGTLKLTPHLSQDKKTQVYKG